MKRSGVLQAKLNNKIRTAFVTIIIFLATQSTYAQEIAKSTEILLNTQYVLGVIIPIIAVVVFLLLLLIYVLRIIAKDTFKRWALSIIIAATAFYISNALFHIN